MRSAPPHRAAVPRVIVPGFAFVIAVTVLCGCGGGMSARVAAEPAVRIDRPAPATPQATARSGFEEESVSEERLDDAGATAQPTQPAQPASRDRRDAANAPRNRSDQPETSRARREASHKNEDAAADDAPPLRHVLRRGQTLYSVAKMYGVEVAALMQANGIKNARHVAANQMLVIPVPRTAKSASPGPKEGGVMQASLAPGLGLPDAEDSPSPKKKKDARGDDARAAAQPALAWPVQGAVTASFGRRGKSDHHEGIDIDGDTGDPIRAAASGIVAFAGNHGDYGRTVVIDHGEGWRTIYAHASTLKVEEGDPVRVGDTIAEVGRSGNARGTHLHFEVRREGRAVNPIPYLRSSDTLTAGVVPAPKPRSKQAKGKSAPR